MVRWLCEHSFSVNLLARVKDTKSSRARGNCDVVDATNERIFRHVWFVHRFLCVDRSPKYDVVVGLPPRDVLVEPVRFQHLSRSFTHRIHQIGEKLQFGEPSPVITRASFFVHLPLKVLVVELGVRDIRLNLQPLPAHIQVGLHRGVVELLVQSGILRILGCQIESCDSRSKKDSKSSFAKFVFAASAHIKSLAFEVGFVLLWVGLLNLFDELTSCWVVWLPFEGIGQLIESEVCEV
mmetsp:Transcript_3483/g.6598  ORF Transcript_3483/g.6598 Transcript_3483/m.6598 type:complete len:237 (-) Transcript_3483:370-1080(-)